MKERAEFGRRTNEGSVKGIAYNTTLKSETTQSVQKTTTRELMLGLTENWGRKSILCNDYSCAWLRLLESSKTALRFDLLRKQQEQPVQIFSTWTKSV